MCPSEADVVVRHCGVPVDNNCIPLRRKAGILSLPERLGPFTLGGGSVAGFKGGCAFMWLIFTLFHFRRLDPRDCHCPIGKDDCGESATGQVDCLIAANAHNLA